MLRGSVIVMLDEGVRNAAAAPSARVEQCAEFEISLAVAKFLDETETARKYRARIDRRAIRNRPIVVGIIHRAGRTTGVQLRGMGREVVLLFAEETSLAAGPERLRIVRERFEALLKVAGRKSVIVVHRADMRPGASKRHGVPVGIEPTPGAGHVPGAELPCDGRGDGGIVAVIGHHDFNRLRVLRAQAREAAAQSLRPVARHQRDAQLYWVAHAVSKNQSSRGRRHAHQTL